MKRIVALTAVALMTTVGAASAMTTPSSVEISEIRGYAPNADLSRLTNAEVATLQAIIHGEDRGNHVGARVRNFLRNAG